jgi:serine protease
VKRKRALRILITFALVGFAAAWLYSRGREATSYVDTHEDAQPIATLDDDSYAETIPGELVVEFKSGESREQIAALGQKLGVQFDPASSYADVDEVYTVDTTDAEHVLAELRADSADVDAADYQFVYGLPEDALSADEEALPAAVDGRVDPTEKGFPNDPKFKYQWHMDQIHAKDTWKSAQGDGVIVAVIDTGVARVPDLAQTEIVPGWNFVTNTSDATDDHGHGTHVAGTIAQSTHNGIGVAGVAFNAKIMPIKVLSARGSGSVSGIAEGIRWAADHGAKVINMSLGGPMASSVLAKAVKYAHDKGVVVVCAAGNDGRGKVSYPAAYPHAIAVAATQFDETTTFYSNWGKEIDIAAPGGNTRVDQNGDGMMDGVLQNTVVPGDTKRNDYLLFMGTSMASPHVAGVAALVISAGVTNPDAVEKVLKDTARPSKMKKEDGQNRYGAGIIDAAAAVKRAKMDFGGYELGIALAGAALMLLRLRRLGRLAIGLGFGGFAALVMGSSGLFFLPTLGIPGAAVLAHGLPDWDLALGAGLHGNLLLYSALIPVAAALLLYGVPKLRGAIAGLAIGVGAQLLFHAFFRTTEVHLVPHALASTWLVLNALVSFATGYAVLRK